MLRVSFLKTLNLLRSLWLTLALGDDLLSARQKQQLTERFLARAVRQPVSGWPRLRRNQSWEGPVQFKLL